MTLSEAITKVRYLLKEATAAFYSDLEITAWLNEGNMDFHNVKGRPEIWNTTVVSGDYEIGYPTTVTRILKLNFISSGSTNEEFIDEDDYELYRDYIYFYTPLSAGTLIWYGETLPAVVEEEEESFEIDQEFEHAIVNYAVAKGYQKDTALPYQIPMNEYLNAKALWIRKHADKTIGHVRMLKGW